MGERHGFGVQVFDDQSSYEGEWRNDVPGGGTGTFFYADGSEYVGQWKGGKRDGKGRMTYAKSGAEYDGEWRNGRRHGQGTYRMKTGNRYEGSWAHGKQVDASQRVLQTTTLTCCPGWPRDLHLRRPDGPDREREEVQVQQRRPSCWRVPGRAALWPRDVLPQRRAHLRRRLENELCGATRQVQSRVRRAPTIADPGSLPGAGPPLEHSQRGTVHQVVRVERGGVRQRRSRARHQRRTPAAADRRRASRPAQRSLSRHTATNPGGPEPACHGGRQRDVQERGDPPDRRDVARR